MSCIKLLTIILVISPTKSFPEYQIINCEYTPQKTKNEGLDLGIVCTSEGSTNACKIKEVRADNLEKHCTFLYSYAPKKASFVMKNPFCSLESFYSRIRLPAQVQARHCILTVKNINIQGILTNNLNKDS